MDPEILTVLIILLITVILLIFEIIPLDVVAIMCMLALGWSGVLEPVEMLSGFSSSAVMVMIAVMIMGRGIDKTGIMDRFSLAVLKKVGTNPRKIIGLMSLSVGLLSGFVQNMGAVGLFLPGVLNITRRSKLSASSLIMPIGFAAILGGTLTMVGSGPLILINDLLRSASLEPYPIFTVTPLGILLLLAGIGYFFLFGSYVLPRKSNGESEISEQEKLVQALHLPHNIWHFAVPAGSSLIGKTTEQSGIWNDPGVNLLGLTRGETVEYAPWRETVFEAGQELALLGEDESIRDFTRENQLVFLQSSTHFDSLHDPNHSGFAEVIIPHHSAIVGKTIRQFSLRKRFAVEPVMLFSKGEEIRGDFSDHVIGIGDTIIVHGLWERINEVKASIDFVVATPFTTEAKDRSRAWVAVACFLLAVGLALAGFPITLAFLSGALMMVLTRVLSMQEAYQAVEWRVVFLLAGLIPLGIAMQKSGAADFLAQNLVGMVMHKHPLLLILMVGALATVFSLLMSNVGAIVVLAPLVIGIAEISGIDPRPLALMATICVANSFILPTHQVNAFLMSAGGYRNRDYLKAGGGMTLIFLLIVVFYFYLFMIK